jgi:CRISPR-associated protein Csm2
MADNWDKLKQFKGHTESGNANTATPAKSSVSAWPAAPPRSGGAGSYQQSDRQGLPSGYLVGGYFNDEGNIKDELLVDHAREVARLIGLRGQGYEGIKNAQLRKFYGHVRAADTRMNYDAPFEAVRPSILELSAFVAEAAGKRKVPAVFQQFMDKNLENIRDAKSFRQGFVKHFQAVVGFFSYFYKD